MPARKKAGHQQLDDIILADNDLANFGGDPPANILGPQRGNLCHAICVYRRSVGITAKKLKSKSFEGSKVVPDGRDGVLFRFYFDFAC